MDQKFVSFVVPSVSSPLATKAWEEENLLTILDSYRAKPAEGYYSMFSPSHQEITWDPGGIAHFKSFRGTHKLTLDTLALDFDSKDDTNLALADVRAFLATHVLAPSQYALFESGSKGYHLCVHTSLLGELLAPHAQLNERVKSFAQLLKQKYKTLDSGIYDIQRKFRIPFSVHPKTGKPKRLLEGSWPLVPGYQHDGLSELFMTAQIAAGPTTTAEPEVLARGTEEGPVLQAFKELKNKPCISKMLDHSFPSGERNQALLIMVNDLMNSGHTAHQTKEKLKSWCAKHGADKFDEMAAMIKRWESGSGRYTHYCDDPVRAPHCGMTACAHWGNLSGKFVETMPTPKDATEKDLAQKEQKTALIRVKRFADSLIEKEHLVYHISMQLFFHYDGEKYVETHEDEVKARFERSMSDLANIKYSNELVAALRRKCGITDQVFRNSSDGYINFKNGHFNKRTGQLEERLASRFFTYCLNFDYNPDAQCPTWDKFMHDVFVSRDSGLVDEECVTALEEYMGYTLAGGENKFHRMLLAVGIGGANGKGTIWNVMRHLIGDGGYSSLNVKMLCNPKERETLDAKLANLSGEESLDAFLKHESELKSLSATDAITWRPLWRKAYSAPNRAKLWMACNEVPASRDNSGGWKRRFIILRFNNKAADAADLAREQEDYIHGHVYLKDMTLEDRLKAEASGVFNKVWAAYQRAEARGSLTIPASSREEMDSLQVGDTLEDLLGILLEPGTGEDVVWSLDLQKAVASAYKNSDLGPAPSGKRIVSTVKRMFKVHAKHTKMRRGLTGIRLIDQINSGENQDSISI